MDFYQIRTKELKTGGIEVYPDFVVGRSRDLMVKGRSFYAIWDEEKGLWSTDEYDVQRLVDEDLHAFAKKTPSPSVIKDLRSFNSNAWSQFKKFVSVVSDNAHPIDEKLTFSNTEVKKSDYVSRRLPYALSPGDHSAWDELVGTLYSVEERQKIEWAIGSVVSGDSKKIQKFLVLYGPAGTGKSTILNIVEKLFTGYSTTFEAKALAGNNNSFATEVFKNNPLVAIQHDGDLSRIEDNTKLNSIISHEEMTMNEKYKPSYTARVNAFLFMGTNQPVKISDAKSGIIRRLIDVSPTGVKIPPNHYHTLMSKIDFELGAIAQHCLDVYLELGKNYYAGYRPLEMMFQTDVFFNFIEAHFDIFKAQDGVSLKQAYSLYKAYCDETGVQHPLPQYKMREELRNYFDGFNEKAVVDDIEVRSWYSGFNANKFKAPTEEANTFSLVIEETRSLFDEVFADAIAQYTKDDGTPVARWSTVRTRLSELDTSRVHYVKVPENHIVIDFDLKGINGHKSLERNLEAASVWPATYAELSRSGSGVHLHYTYEGDTSQLANLYAEGIEIKTFNGGASLRRRMSRCNSVPISVCNAPLPLKEKKQVLESNTIQSERGLRDLIGRNLRKEIHPGTKPSIDFIAKILDEAYQSGMQYDVTDLRSRILAFANNSTNQPLAALKTVQKMKFKSDEIESVTTTPEVKDDRRTFYDVEVYPNLFVLCWKYEEDPNVVRMINPSAAEVELLLRMKLVGFNNRRYDNHIIYAASMGYNNQQLFELSQKLIANDRQSPFGSAYNISYADVWDYSSIKKSLKKFEIDLGIHHMELDIPWDQPVPDDMIDKVVEYCVNDVIATEIVAKDREQDFVARQILAALSGLSVNDTTQRHTAQILFGDDRRPQQKFIYTDLSKEFPGYVFERGKSSYRDEDPGEGGYVYAEPGMYENVALLDVASMHPQSIELLNLFGDEYTKRFSDLKAARLAIKRGDFDSARQLLDGRLAPFLPAPERVSAGDGAEGIAKTLGYALKIVINIVYGLTSAKFDNPFRDPRNVDNIVAKRGALFMIDLKHAVQEQGFDVAHIKTDSIKIPDATPEIIQFVMDFGKKYGYEFEHEATYDKFCLVNDAVYIARKGDEYTAVGAQFQHPYVFKKLFAPDEEITFDDYCETKSVVQGVMYLDFEAKEKPLVLESGEMQHVGKTGRFVPVMFGGAVLYRVKDDKFFAVTGTKDHLWVEAEMAKNMGEELAIDLSYFDKLVDAARDAIDHYGSFVDFVR